MNVIRSKVFPQIILVIATLAILVLRFSQVFQHPNGVLYSKSGDGLKNYFLFAFYLKYDQGLRFSGFNYPYGENLLYTDSHPLYALLLNWVDDHLFPLASHSIALINLSVLAGVVLAVLLLYQILRRFEMPSWYSAMVALAIILLSPQWSRMHGHISLSHLFVIPLIWYILILYEDRPGLPRSILLLLTGVFVGGLHMYFLATFTLFLLAYWIIEAINQRGEPIAFFKKRWALPVLALAPLVFFQAWMGISDGVIDRPVSPYGFYTYHANFWSVFLPHYSVVNQVIGNLFDIRIEWEGRSYIGFVPLFVCVVAAVRYLHNILNRSRRIAPIYQMRENQKFYLWASVLLLLFSMCIPFKWGLQFIPDLIAPLKQLRALGRFSWVFYYVINVMAAVTVYMSYKNLRHKQVPYPAAMLIGFALLSWWFDGTSFFVNTTENLVHQNDKLERTDDNYLARFKEANIDPADYQAIFSLPLVAIRTDKLTFERDLTGYQEALKCAYHTGIPLLQSTASRPSLSQSLSSIQMISDDRITKSRLKDMNDSPILLLVSNKSALLPEEKKWVDRSRLLWSDDYITLGHLDLKAFENSNDSLVSQYHILRDSLDCQREICVVQGAGPVLAPFLDRPERSPRFCGIESYTFSRGDTLFSGQITVPQLTQMELSFWLFIDPVYSGMPQIHYQAFDDIGTLIKEEKLQSGSEPDVMDGWVRCSVLFEASPGRTIHQVLVEGRKTAASSLLIKPTESTAYHTLGDCLLYDNFILTQAPQKRGD